MSLEETIKDLLAQLAKTLKIQAPSGPFESGKLIELQIIPSLAEVRLPMLVDASVDLLFLTKSVRFLTDPLPSLFQGGDPSKKYDELLKLVTSTDHTEILGGQPVASTVPVEPVLSTSTTPKVLPPISPITGTIGNAISGVPGIIGGLVGKLKVPAGLLPITLEVKWSIKHDRKSDAAFPLFGAPFETPGGLEGEVLKLIPLPLFVEWRRSELPTVQFKIKASVTLRVGAIAAPAVNLPEVTLTVPVIPLPLVVLAFWEKSFITRGEADNAVLVAVPHDSPVDSAQQAFSALASILKTISDLQGVVSFPLQAVSFLAGLELVGTVASLVADTRIAVSYGRPPPSKDRLQLMHVPSPSGYIVDGDQWEDEIRGAMIVGVPGTAIRFCEDHEDSDDETLLMTTGNAMWAAAPDWTPEPITDLRPASTGADGPTLQYFIDGKLKGQIDASGARSGDIDNFEDWTESIVFEKRP